MGIYSIILCGGAGARLWPESTAAYPKPFIDLIGDRSLFQRTVTRMAVASGGRAPLIVTGLAYVDQVRAQLGAIGSDGFIIAEPAGRDSGPALLAAAVWIARLDPEGVAVAVASDHHIPDEAAFAAAVEASVGAARSGEIVTFGVKPAHAATGYGYIRAGDALGDRSAVLRVGEFVEKPNGPRAEALVADGCLWNSGNFMFRAQSLLAEAREHAPDLLNAVEAAVFGAVVSGGLCRLGDDFLDAPKRSIDVAVIEKTRRAAVLPIDYAWTDLGSWDSVWASSDHDRAGNATLGAVVAQDSENCLLRAGEGHRIVAIGLRNLAVVVRDRDVLVTELSLAPTLKPALEALETMSPGRQPPAPTLASRADSAGRLEAWLWDSALPLWWCFGADHDHGGYHESLGQDLRPTGADRRARVQARQVHVYATAGAMGWPGPWRAAIQHGLDYLQTRYRRADGLYRAVVDPHGKPLDDTAVLYDQAFVLLALASVAGAEPHRAGEMAHKGLELLAAIRRTLSHPGGGFVAADTAPSFLANPLMHLFEAALAWEAVSDDAAWADLARELAALFLDRLYDCRLGAVREVFDAAWDPAAGPEGRVLEPGHQFEWAWLLGRWVERHDDPRARQAARALYLTGAAGVDPNSGLVFDSLLDDLSIRQPTSRLWPQTERVKAASLLAGWPSQAASSLLVDAASAVEAMERYLATPITGLWWDALESAARPTETPAPASSFYHIIGAVAAVAGGRR